jgi:hypothetical protein
VHIVKIQSRPYTVINGKDFAVYRWFEPGRHGPLFIQLAGRTQLTREDLPTDDWIVLQTRSGITRVSTAWRKQWFDYKVDATRKLAFLGASTAGSLFLSLRYLARRFGIATEDAALATRASEIDTGKDAPYGFCLDRVADAGLTSNHLVTLELPPYFDASAASELVGSAAS